MKNQSFNFKENEKVENQICIFARQLFELTKFQTDFVHAFETAAFFIRSKTHSKELLEKQTP